MGLFNSSSSTQTTEEQQVAIQVGNGGGPTSAIGGGANQAQQAQDGGAAVGFSNGTVVGGGTSLTQDNIINSTVEISDTPAIVSAALSAFQSANQTAEESVAALHEDTTTALSDLQATQQTNAALSQQLAQQNSVAAGYVSPQGQLVTSSGFNLTTTETILAALAALLAILFYLHKR